MMDAFATTGWIQRVSRCSTGISALWLLAGCAAETVNVPVSPLVPRATVASVEVLPASAGPLAPGGNAQLAAVVRDTRGQVLTDRTVSWSSASPAIASVSASGLVSAVAAGTTTINASSEGATGAATVSVRQPVSRVVISPQAIVLVSGGVQTLAAQVEGPVGVALTDRPIVWTSANPAVASVSAGGIVSATGVGESVITATSEGVAGVATVKVQQPVATVLISPADAILDRGQAAAFTATARDASGNAVVGAVVEWSSSSPAIAAVNQVGLVTGIGVGRATIQASVAGKSGSVVVNIVPPTASVRLTPKSPSVYPQVSTQLSVVALDETGATVTGRSTVWRSSSPDVATVSSAGLLSGIAPGRVIVSVAIGNVTDTTSAFVWSQNFSGKDLSERNLSGQTLSWVDFSNATLIGANLRSTRVTSSTFRNADMQLADLRGALFVASDFTGTVFSQSIFDRYTAWPVGFSPQGRGMWGPGLDYAGQNLSARNFSGFDFQRSRFVGTNLRGTNLRSVVAESADFTNSDMREVALSGANLADASLIGVLLAGATFDRYTRWPTPFSTAGRGMWGPGLDYSGQNLSGRNLSGFDFQSSRFVGTNLRGTNLRSVVAESADFTNSDMREVALSGANLADASLTGVLLVGATFDRYTRWPTPFTTAGRGMWGPGLDYSGQNLSDRNLSGYDFQSSRFVGTNLRRTNLRSVVAESADFTNADLRDVEISGANLADANFTGAQLTGAKFDRNTRWPTGMDPIARGAILVP